MLNTPVQMLVLMLVGWVNEQHRAVNAYLTEENRVLRELHASKRLRFTDDRRRKLSARGKQLGRRGLREFGAIVTPDTILRWHRELISRKYDGSAQRGPGRPAIAKEIRALALRMASDNESLGYSDRRRTVEVGPQGVAIDGKADSEGARRACVEEAWGGHT